MRTPRSGLLAPHARTIDLLLQGQCGSCWAHSAVETLESAFAMAGHDLTSLSVQQVVSCDNGNGDMGCQGGMYVVVNVE